MCADKITKEQRSRNMAAIKGKDTKPEMAVRRFLHSHGFRYRLHVNKLPGKPDIVLPKYKTAIFVHGCFWHQHKGCQYAYIPKSNTEKWEKKFEQNKIRDRQVIAEYQQLQWNPIVVWECEVRNGSFVTRLAEAGLVESVPIPNNENDASRILTSRISD